MKGVCRVTDRALLPADTPPAVAAMQRQAQQRLTPDARVRLAVQMSEDVRTIMLEGFRARDPLASEAQLRRRMMHSLYGDVWRRLSPEP
jgi:hypothetical protein